MKLPSELRGGTYVRSSDGFWAPHFTFWKRLLGAAISFLVAVSPAMGQASAPKSGEDTAQLRWQKYVNRKYGFSFMYPDMCRSVPSARDDVFQKYLLRLDECDNECGTYIIVGIGLRPFHPGGLTRKLIGRHVFYAGMGGPKESPSDSYETILKGKDLFVLFEQCPNVNRVQDAEQLELQILKTFRTF